MNELSTRCLNTFPAWLRNLGDDAAALAGVLADPAAPEATRRHVACALTYLFKSLDLIPDGIEDLGYLDDAFVLRVGADLAIAETPRHDPGGHLARLGRDTALVRELLGEHYERLVAYVRGLEGTSARGRSVRDVVADATARDALAAEVRAWAKSYQPPSFSRDEKNLVKLKAFLSTRLSG